jgi:hypothetical protein
MGHQQAVKWRFHQRSRELVVTYAVRALHYVLFMVILLKHVKNCFIL